MSGAEQVSIRLPTDVLARVDRAVYDRRRAKAAGRASRSSVIATLVADALQPATKEDRS
ncbi:hypothetical protein [Bosea caraganae]|uniref:hypothetical protein n=1 Tax=Bosea caraganae TaxID=2763117 RepID=UPI0015F0836D|nr:hypothetical protein [Bosea caraganae]